MDAKNHGCTALGKKHPCPDCGRCQWCSERRCQLCLGWLKRDTPPLPAAPDAELRKDNHESQ